MRKNTHSIEPKSTNSWRHWVAGGAALLGSVLTLGYFRGWFSSPESGSEALTSKSLTAQDSKRRPEASGITSVSSSLFAQRTGVEKSLLLPFGSQKEKLSAVDAEIKNPIPDVFSHVGDAVDIQIPHDWYTDPSRFIVSLNATLDGEPLAPGSDKHWLTLTPPIPYQSTRMALFPTPPVNDLAVVGSTAYLASEWGLVIVNVSDITAPAQLGNKRVLGTPWSIQVAQSVVYVTAQQTGMYIFDVSDTAAPKTLGFYQVVAQSQALGFQVIADKAYLAMGFAGLQVVDVSNVTAPTLLGNLTLPNRVWAINVCVQGGEAYMVGTSGLQIIDISNATSLTLLGEFNPSQIMTDVKVVGSTAFMVTKKSELQVVDVSDPTAPALVGALNMSDDGDLQGLHVMNDTAYVFGHAGVQIIDVSNPAAPVRLGGDGVDGVPTADVKAVGRTLFAATVEGFSTLSLGVDGSLQGLATATTDSSAILLSARDNYGQLAVNHFDVIVKSLPVLAQTIPDESLMYGEELDFRVPTETFQGSDGYSILPPNQLAGGAQLPSWMKASYDGMHLSSFRQGEGISLLQVVGSHAYLIGGNYLQIVDVSNASMPTLVGQYDVQEAYVSGLQVMDNLVYISAETLGLLILDVSNSSMPKLLSQYHTSSTALGLCVADSFVYVAESDGVSIISVSNASAPTLLGYYRTQTLVDGVYIVGKTLYAMTSVGLDLVDVNDASSPVFLGNYSLPDSVNNMQVVANVAYAAAGYSGVQFIDVSNPRAPQSLGAFRKLDFAVDIQHLGCNIFVAGRNSGVQIVDVCDLNAPKRLAWYRTQGYDAKGVRVVKGIVYAADSATGLEIFDVRWRLTGKLPYSYHQLLELPITAVDAYGGSVSTLFRLSLNNRPPELKTSIPDTTVYVHQSFKYTIPLETFSDPDNEPLIYYVSMIGATWPQWLQYNAGLRELFGVPGSGDRNTWSVLVTVNDGFGGAANTSFLIKVPNRPPQRVGEIPLQTGGIWRSFRYLVPSFVFEDQDGDNLTYVARSIENKSLPGWLRFYGDSSKPIFLGTPRLIPFDAGVSQIQIFAFDGRSYSGPADFTIDVNSGYVYFVAYYSLSGIGFLLFTFLGRYLRHRALNKQQRVLLENYLPLKDKTISEQRSDVKEDVRPDVESPDHDGQAALIKGFDQLRDLILYKNDAKMLEAPFKHFIRMADTFFYEAKDVGIYDAVDIKDALDGVLRKVAAGMKCKKHYGIVLPWLRYLNRLLELILTNQTAKGRHVLTKDKEAWIKEVNSLRGLTNVHEEHGVTVKFHFELARATLLSMTGTQNLGQRAGKIDLFKEIVGVALAPPIGIITSYYHFSRLPKKWLPSYMAARELSVQVKDDVELLTQLQMLAQTSTSWVLQYAIIDILESLIHQTENDSIKQQALRGDEGRGLRGLYFFSRYPHRSCCDIEFKCCAEEVGWIRGRAYEALERLGEAPPSDISEDAAGKEMDMPLLAEEERDLGRSDDLSFQRL